MSELNIRFHIITTAVKVGKPEVWQIILAPFIMPDSMLGYKPFNTLLYRLIEIKCPILKDCHSLANMSSQALQLSVIEMS